MGRLRAHALLAEATVEEELFLTVPVEIQEPLLQRLKSMQ